jgi:hypothetical protein
MFTFSTLVTMRPQKIMDVWITYPKFHIPFVIFYFGEVHSKYRMTFNSVERFVSTEVVTWSVVELANVHGVPEVLVLLHGHCLCVQGFQKYNFLQGEEILGSVWNVLQENITKPGNLLWISHTVWKHWGSFALSHFQKEQQWKLTLCNC